MLYVCHWAKTAAATAQEPDRLQQLIQLLVGGNSFHMSRFTPLTRPFIHTGNHRFPVQLYRFSTGNIIFFFQGIIPPLEMPFSILCLPFNHRGNQANSVLKLVAINFIFCTSAFA